MSMSQEEIEALMSGLDIEDEEADSSSVKVNTQEIEELLSQTEDYKNEEKNIDNKTNETVKTTTDKSENVIEEKLETFVKTDEIEQLLNDIELNSETTKKENEIETSFEGFGDLESFQEDINLQNNIKENIDISENIKKDIVKNDERSDDDIAKDWTSSRINEGVFPFPAEKDTKVVNQLSQVANDSEEKVSQIFDVLSLTLDNNNEFRTKLKNIEVFVAGQSKLLESLNKKFPNINVFNEQLKNTSNVSKELNSLKSQMNDEDAQIFQAMELMQFNDINRQKIERVMSVIRKLSLYLNNLFEDDGSTTDVAVAKHIHGDENNDLIGEDLDKLIAEFSNNK